ncbi:MAG: hypothetical protein L0226_05465 [Acidobacteria bacterium]|nr:hypothetical protein [Acidobacteriota bacterium]
MDEERTSLARTYKRAAIGLAIAAILWTAVLLSVGVSEEEKTHWLIPIGAVALSVIFFSLYLRSKESP